MNKRYTTFNNTRKTIVLAIGLIISIISPVLLQSPTHALSLDLTPATKVTNTIPIVNEVVPILIGNPVSTPAPVQVSPIKTITTPTPTQTTVPTTVTTTTQPLATQPAANNSTEVTPATTEQADTINTQSPQQVSSLPIRSPFLTNGLLQNETELAQAPAHIASPALVYPSRTISPEVANILFYGGIITLIIGGYIAFVTRTRLGAA